MAASQNAQKVLFTIRSLPVGTVIRLLTKKQMGDEYYIQPTKNKDNLLKPKMPIGTPHFPFLNVHTTTTTTTTSMSTNEKKFYKCYENDCVTYVTDSYGVDCPDCSETMDTVMTYWAGTPSSTTSESQASTGEGVGFVKDAVTYMVMDNLIIKPMSNISCITLLNKVNVKDVNMALKLPKESFQSEDTN